MGKHRKSSKSSDSSSSHKSHHHHKKKYDKSHSRDSREEQIMYPNMPYPGMPPMMMRPGGYYPMRFPRAMQYYPPQFPYQGGQPPYSYWPGPVNQNPEVKQEEKAKEIKTIKLKIQTTLPFNEDNVKYMVKMEFDSEWMKKEISSCE